MTPGSEPRRRSTAGPAAELHAVLEGLIGSLASAAAGPDVAEARRVFDERRGRVFEDEELWEPWTQAFLEWYALECTSPDGAPPLAAREFGEENTPERGAILRALLTSHRSVFEIRGLPAGAVDLIDLVGGGSFRVAEPRALHGVSLGDVAELRLIGFRDRVWFGNTFCFHPAGTRDAIAGHARRMKTEGAHRQQIVDYCANLRIRCERYRHVSPSRVYRAAAELTAGP